MNIFAAITILSRISPDDFLNLGTAGRTQRFADLIGAERMVRHQLSSLENGKVMR